MRGAAFAEVVDQYMPHQAVVMPAAAARGFDAFAETASRWEACDVALLRYLRATGLSCQVYLPNLVEHGDLPSLVGRRSEFQGRRQAVCYPGSASTFAPDGAGVAGLRVIPYLAWWPAGTAVCQVRESGDQWRHIPTVPLLRERGTEDPTRSDAFADAVGRLDEVDLLRSRVGDGALGEVWTTAYALGLVAAGTGAFAATGPLRGDPAEGPLALMALATLAPGGLRRLVPPSELGWLSDRLAPLTIAAVRLAVSEVRQGRAAPID